MFLESKRTLDLEPGFGEGIHGPGVSGTLVVGSWSHLPMVGPGTPPS